MADNKRITAPAVKKIIDDHLHKHDLVIDKRQDNFHDVLFGEKGDDGVVTEIDELQSCYKDINNRLTKIESSINWGVLVVLGSFIVSLTNLVMK